MVFSHFVAENFLYIMIKYASGNYFTVLHIVKKGSCNYKLRSVF